MKPHDMLQVGRDFYEVHGVHLGATGQEDIISLRGVTQSAGTAHGHVVSELMVPLPLINAAVEGGNAVFLTRAPLA